jgi:hypothetical protein
MGVDETDGFDHHARKIWDSVKIRFCLFSSLRKERGDTQLTKKKYFNSE